MAKFAKFLAMRAAQPLIGDTEEGGASPFGFKLLDHSGFDFVRERIEGAHAWSKQWSISHEVQETETPPSVVGEAPKVMQAIGDFVRSALDCERADAEAVVEEVNVVASLPVASETHTPDENPIGQFDDLRECITEFRDDMCDLFRDYCENPAEFDFRAGLNEAIGHLHDCLDDWRDGWLTNAPWKHPGADQASLL